MPRAPVQHKPVRVVAKAHASGEARREMSAAQRGYGSRWRRVRAAFLREHPLCVMCESDGVVKQATVVDHIKPHKGDPNLFWDSSNWQALCVHHHASHKQRQERGSDK